MHMSVQTVGSFGLAEYITRNLRQDIVQSLLYMNVRIVADAPIKLNVRRPRETDG